MPGWSPWPQQNRQVTGHMVESWCRESVYKSGREPGGCARCWFPWRAECEKLHMAQRASKATLNSFSLLILFFVWLGIFLFF